jgi:glutathione peroxidase-family protein
MESLKIAASFILLCTFCSCKPESQPVPQDTSASQPGTGGGGFYSFTMNDIDGKPVGLSDYRGRAVLVVNVASKCGFTGQYETLEQLYRKYRDRGFVILGFPANNFLSQEPGTNEQIKQFCTSKYGVSFPMFAKISVKGDDIHPLYAYLTDPANSGGRGGDVSWNFNKFLISPNGGIIAHFGSRTEPLSAEMIQAVESSLPD